MTLNFSSIITYRDNTPERKTNFDYVLNWYAQFENFEVIVVEQDDTPKLTNLPSFCKHVFVTNKGIFNRAWGLNVGANHASSDVLIFTDADTIMKPESLLDTVDRCRNEFDVVNPGNLVKNTKKTEEDIYNPQKFNVIQGTNLGGGMVVFRKDAFFLIYGWDEDYRGWGGQDTALERKIMRMLRGGTYTTLDHTLIHLDHYRDNTSDYKKVNYVKNLGLLREQNLMSADYMFKHYQGRKIGDENKYANEV